jgi:hypothetical protein
VLGADWRALVEEAESRAATADSREGRLLRLATIAARYVAAVGNGDRSPVRSVAQALGREPAQIRDQLHDARRAGLLESSGGRGRAGGTLSDDAAALIRRHAQ